MIFKNPLILAIIPVFLLIFVILRKLYPEGSFLFPSGEKINFFKGSVKTWLARRLIYLKVAAIALVIMALARPQINEESRFKKEGIAIMLSIDCSSTMLAEDLELGPLGLEKLVADPTDSKRMNRVDAVKEIARDFIGSRPDDMIGIVAFAAQAYVVCPPTFDSRWLYNSADRIKVGLIKDGTAVGSGILSSINALKGVRAKSKVMILLTDGINNFGETPPLVAAEAARSLGIKIYTIGIASKGQTPYPVKDTNGRKTYKNVRIDIDETVLKKIAEITGGTYYRVSDKRALKNSYAEIGKLETSPMEETTYEEHKDIFGIFLIASLVLLMINAILGNTYLRKIP